MSEEAEGLQADSPTATPIRAAVNCRKLRASAEADVMVLHQASPRAITERLEARSAQRAIGMPANEYVAAKAKPDRRPKAASESPRSRLIDSIRMTNT